MTESPGDPARHPDARRPRRAAAGAGQYRSAAARRGRARHPRPAARQDPQEPHRRRLADRPRGYRDLLRQDWRSGGVRGGGHRGHSHPLPAQPRQRSTRARADGSHDAVVHRRSPRRGARMVGRDGSCRATRRRAHQGGCRLPSLWDRSRRRPRRFRSSATSRRCPGSTSADCWRTPGTRITQSRRTISGRSRWTRRTPCARSRTRPGRRASRLTN